jgi:hypothetical protein
MTERRHDERRVSAGGGVLCVCAVTQKKANLGQIGGRPEQSGRAGFVGGVGIGGRGQEKLQAVLVEVQGGVHDQRSLGFVPQLECAAFGQELSDSRQVSLPDQLNGVAIAVSTDRWVFGGERPGHG